MRVIEIIFWDLGLAFRSLGNVIICKYCSHNPSATRNPHGPRSDANATGEPGASSADFFGVPMLREADYVRQRVGQS